MSLAHATPPMTVDDFVKWAEVQPEGHYELVGGEVIRMPGEGGIHNRVKLKVAILLEAAVATAHFDGVVFTDGMTVRIGPHQAREPDASVTAGPVADLRSMILTDPLIVVEVVSPTSQTVDTSVKLPEYFSVASIAHYLVVNPEARLVIHHARAADGTIATRIVRSGDLRLDPPGLVLPVDGLLTIGRASAA